MVKGKKPTTKKKLKKELEELVGDDGSMLTSKVPILDNPQHTHRTMDQIVPATRQTNDPVTRGYRTYYGESVDDEISEVDLSGAFGYEETEDMDGEDTYKYLVKDMGMEPDDAKERTKQQGKDPSGKKDKKSKYYRDKNFITRATLSEIQRQKAIKMVEDLLTKKNSDNSEVGKKVNADDFKFDLPDDDRMIIPGEEKSQSDAELHLAKNQLDASSLDAELAKKEKRPDARRASA